MTSVALLTSSPPNGPSRAPFAGLGDFGTSDAFGVRGADGDPFGVCVGLTLFDSERVLVSVTLTPAPRRRSCLPPFAELPTPAEVALPSWAGAPAAPSPDALTRDCDRVCECDFGGRDDDRVGVAPSFAAAGSATAVATRDCERVCECDFGVRVGERVALGDCVASPTAATAALTTAAGDAAAASDAGATATAVVATDGPSSSSTSSPPCFGCGGAGPRYGCASGSPGACRYRLSSDANFGLRKGAVQSEPCTKIVVKMPEPRMPTRKTTIMNTLLMLQVIVQYGSLPSAEPIAIEACTGAARRRALGRRGDIASSSDDRVECASLDAAEGDAVATGCVPPMSRCGRNSMLKGHR